MIEQDGVAWLRELVESAHRPGLMSTAGMAVERRCQSEMASYFRGVAKAVGKLHLEELVKAGTTPELGAHQAEMLVHNVLRHHRAILLLVLSTNLRQAALIADRIAPFAEVDIVGTPVDKVGLSGQQAADYAAKQAAELVTGIDATTLKQIKKLISEGIEEQWGVPSTAREIKALFDDMTTKRARMIASTEMNAAMSWSTLQKLTRIGVEYKQLIIVPDEIVCPQCSSIADAGPVPVDEPFVTDEGDEFDSTPIHPNCRCATTGARGPDEEEG